ncbi:putative syntaxin-7-like [Tupanvirus deep ocean]|uniref:Syntaxin-7-like n=2 Tax=Tupanvirus TaxID=2094720 RepID=A0AC62A8X8_9VIRU|nr:putative syntaxin-7-like [Tupanvirus deep ocean]QKU34194.1 putative syntaxin-7-like [Tupanvirus deep ocean]
MEKQQLILDIDNYEKQKQDELRKLGKDVVDLQGVFVDVKNITSYQNDILDNIENAIERSDVDVEKGTAELLIAKKHKESCRNKMCLCWILLIIISIILMIIFVSYLASSK